MAEDYLQYLQVEANASVLTINPFEVHKWRHVVIRTALELKDFATENLTHTYPAGRPTPYHAEAGVLRVDHLYRTPQSLHYAFDPIIAMPVAFDFGLTLRFVDTSVADEAVVGFFSGDADKFRKSTVALSFGKLGAGALTSNLKETVGDFLLNAVVELSGNYLDVTPAVVVDPNRIRVPLPFDMSAFVSTPTVTYVVVVADATTNDGVYKIVAVETTINPNDTIVVEGAALTGTPNITFEIHKAVPGGVLDQGYINTVNSLVPVIGGSPLRNVTLTGGQAGISVGAGQYTTLHLHLDSVVPFVVPGAAPLEVFLYRSTTNFPSSYTRIGSPVPFVPQVVSPGLYKIQFSSEGLSFAEGEWIKFVPVDPGVEINFADVFDPLRLIKDSQALRSDWPSTISALTPFTAKLLLSSSGGVYDSVTVAPLVLPIGFDFTTYHNYKVEVSDGRLHVFVDGVETFTTVSPASAFQYEIETARDVGGFGFMSLASGAGMSYFARNVKFTQFNIDERIVELPALYDRYETQTLVLESALNQYEIEPRGVLRFPSLDVRDVDNNIIGDLRDKDFLVAEYTSFALRRISSQYGVLIGVTGEDSVALRNRTASVWVSLLDGPRISSIQRGVQAFLDIPIPLVDGFVTKEPTNDLEIEIDGVVYRFPDAVGVGINPATRHQFKLGDYVPAFTPVAGGVTVRDHIIQRDWWYSDRASEVFHELQKYHNFEIEIDDRLFSPGLAADIRAFVDRIRPLGDRYTLVTKTEVAENLIIESNPSRTALLNGDPDAVFVGDSSDPARVCFPYAVTLEQPDVYGFGAFGNLTTLAAQAAYAELVGDKFLNDTGFGDPDKAFVDFQTIVSGVASGTTAVPSTFTEGSSVFGPVVPGDYLIITSGTQLGTYLIREVTSSTVLIVNSTFKPFLAVSAGVSYTITRAVFQGDAGSAFILVGGYAVPEGSRMTVQADSGPQISVLIGVIPQDEDEIPVLTPEQVVDAFLFSNGEPRVPGTSVHVEYLQIDTRDLPPLVNPPRRACIETLSKKGHNSKLTFTAPPPPVPSALVSLNTAAGVYLGHVTYPGLDHIDLSAEPNSLPYTAKDYPTSSPAGERDVQQSFYKPGDPGLAFDINIDVNDGTTIRRDLQPRYVGSRLAYAKVGVAPGFVGYNEPSVGVPYQAPFAGDSQFGTFYADYVFPTPDFDFVFTDGAPVEANDTLSIASLSAPTLHSGLGTVYPTDTFEDLTTSFGLKIVAAGDDSTVVNLNTFESLEANFVRAGVAAGDYLVILNTLAIGSYPIVSVFSATRVIIGGIFPAMSPNVVFEVRRSRVRPGDVLNFGAGNHTVTEVISDTRLRFTPVELVPAAGVSYTLRGLPSVGDFVVVDAVLPTPLLAPVDDRVAHPVYEGDIYAISAVIGLAVKLQKINTIYSTVPTAADLQDGSRTDVVFGVSATTPPIVKGRIVRTPLPYSLNPVIPFERTSRVNKTYNLLSDDLRMLEDSSEISVYLPNVEYGNAFRVTHIPDLVAYYHFSDTLPGAPFDDLAQPISLQTLPLDLSKAALWVDPAGGAVVPTVVEPKLVVPGYYQDTYAIANQFARNFGYSAVPYTAVPQIQNASLFSFVENSGAFSATFRYKSTGGVLGPIVSSSDTTVKGFVLTLAVGGITLALYDGAGGSATAQVLAPGIGVADGAWHFLSFVGDGVNVFAVHDLIVYPLAAIVDDATWITNWGAGGYPAGSSGLAPRIGYDYFSAVPFDGILDSLNVFSRGLALAEVYSIRDDDSYGGFVNVNVQGPDIWRATKLTAGQRLAVIDQYDESEVIELPVDDYVDLGVGVAIAAGKFKRTGYDFAAAGVQVGQTLNVLGSTLGNNQSLIIEAIESLDTIRVPGTPFLGTPETGLLYVITDW